jgi:hypothetical protein
LQELAADTDLQATLAAVAAKGQQQLTKEEAKARKRSLQGLGLPSFQQKLQVSAAAAAAIAAAAACWCCLCCLTVSHTDMPDSS